MRDATELKRALARESIAAMVAMRTTGQMPTPESAPTLMAVWQAARDKLLLAGVDKAPAIFHYEGLRCLYSALWNDWGQLERFYLHDSRKGVLLLAGDTNGPVFRAPSGQAQAVHMPSQHTTNSKVHP